MTATQNNEHKHDENCIFCKIIKGDIPSEKIYEDDDTYAFLSVGPINKGHTLVIPKDHHVSVFDCPRDTFEKVMSVVHELSPIVRDALDAGGVNIGMNNEATAGQEVFHMHAHIIPRFEDDGFVFWPNKEYDTSDEMKEFGRRIRGHFKK
jgi:histidine triad (HIT) family protein